MRHPCSYVLQLALAKLSQFVTRVPASQPLPYDSDDRFHSVSSNGMVDTLGTRVLNKWVGNLFSTRTSRASSG